MGYFENKGPLGMSFAKGAFFATKSVPCQTALLSQFDLSTSFLYKGYEPPEVKSYREDAPHEKGPFKERPAIYCALYT